MTIRLVQACELDATPAAVIRAAMAADRVPGWLRRAYRLVDAQLAGEGIAVAGPAFASYTRSGDRVEVEAGYPVPVAVAGNGIVVPSGLPGGPAAITLHEGSAATLDVAYRRIETWLAGHGFTARGRHWERYLVGSVTGEPDPSRWRTEVVVPYSWQRWVPAGTAGACAASAGHSASLLVV
jgi:effector-binding domain-containing protein